MTDMCNICVILMVCIVGQIHISNTNNLFTQFQIKIQTSVAIVYANQIQDYFIKYINTNIK